MTPQFPEEPRFRRIRHVLAVALACCVLGPCAQAQAPAQPPVPDADYAAGIALLAQLHDDPAADAPIFEHQNIDHAIKSLMAVSSRGQSPTATLADWAAMHRATDALIELFIWQKQLFKASVFANFQFVLFHNYDGDEVRALAAAQRALALQKQSGVAGTLYVSYENIGQSQIRLGRVEEGVAALKDALAVVDDPNSPAAASIALELIQVLAASGRLPQAHEQLAAFERRAETAPSRLYRARSIIGRTDLLIAEGHYNEALDSLKNAGSVIKGDPKEDDLKLEIVLGLMLVGTDAMSSLPYADAKALLVRIDREFPGMPIPISGFARELLNYRRRLAGEFDALLREDTASLDAARSQHNLPAQVDALLTLAIDYVAVNEANQAIASLEEGVALMKEAPAGAVTPYLRFRVLLVLANTYLEKKNVGKATSTLRTLTSEMESMKEANTQQRYGRIYGEAQLARARAAVLDDDPDTARDILRKALDPKLPQLGKYTRSSVLLQAARTERDAKEKPSEAVRLYLEAIEAFHAEKDQRSEVAARLQLVRYLATDAQKLPDSRRVAAEQIDRARVLAQSVDLAEARWRLAFAEGVLAENAGQRDAAIEAYKRALAELDTIRAGLSQGEQRQAILDNDDAQELFRRLEALQTAAGQREAAWQTLEQDKARTFLESLRGRRFQPAAAATASPLGKELADLETQILTTRVALNPGNEGLLRSAGQQPEVLQARLRTLESRFALARQQAGLETSRATAPLSLRPVTIAEVQHKLPPATALIEYAILDGELAAFVLWSGGSQQLHWKADTRALPAQLRQFHDLLATPDTLPSAETDALSQLLFAPIEAALPPGIRSLLIVPSGGLAYIPFSVLRLHAGGTVLDRYTVSYLPSASTLQFLHPAGKLASAKPFVGALGNVSVDGWAPLPGTLIEAQQISSVYPGLKPVTGASFTHDVAVNALQTSEEVHFATHGLFDEEAPLFSALLLAPGNGQPGRLSLYEVMDLRLKSRLVILSACETNRGRLMGGDEVSGLTRTFLQAGAEDVISSLWKVSDESTALLMTSLHRELRQGRSPAEALRRAEMTVRSKYPAPFYWAAFVNTGVQ